MPQQGNNPEVEIQFNASEAWGRRVHIIDGALRWLEQTPQLSGLTQTTAVVKNEIDHLREHRQHQAAALNSEAQRLTGEGFDNNVVFDENAYLEALEENSNPVAEVISLEELQQQKFDQESGEAADKMYRIQQAQKGVDRAGEAA